MQRITRTSTELSMPVKTAWNFKFSLISLDNWPMVYSTSIAKDDLALPQVRICMYDKIYNMSMLFM